MRQLIDDGRTLLEAELAFQTSRAAFAGKGIKAVAAFGALALALVFFALMALTIGAVLALAPVLSVWGATAAVAGTLLLIAAICGAIARSQWQRIMRHVTGTGAENG